jgi:hypothetical protein
VSSAGWAKTRAAATKRPLVGRTLTARANAASEKAPSSFTRKTESGKHVVSFIHPTSGHYYMAKGSKEYEEPHKAAGEAHLLAAKYADKEGGWRGKWNAERHRAAASVHAEEAGGAWDESKHPRDKDGKFS